MRIRIHCGPVLAGPVLGGLILASTALAGCTTGDLGLPDSASAVPSERPGTQTASAEKHGRLDRLISRYSAAYDVPESLVHRVVKRESNYNPKAYHAGNYGLMQIRYRTAKGMGYDGGPHGLFDAETNLKYAVKYLKGAWLVAGHDEKRADWLYRTGYYYDAKRKGMLDKAGWKALAAVKPAPKAAPAVTAEARKAEPAEAPARTASAAPASSRFGGAGTPGATSVATLSTPEATLGYAGSVPTGGGNLPGVMTAPPERPGS